MSNTVVITGVANGLGRLIAHTMKGEGRWVIGVDIVSKRECAAGNCCNEYFQADLSNAEQIRELTTDIRTSAENLLVGTLINCAAINEIRWFEDLEAYDWDLVMDINARASFLLTRGLLPHLKETQGTVLNIISNASHMPMTASLAYNASKAALHMVTLQMARELTRKYGITVFGISPNKMEGTKMSKYIESRVPEVRGWTPEYARQYQQQSLLTGEETDPAAVADFIGYLLRYKRNHKFLSGCVIPYGA